MTRVKYVGVRDAKDRFERLRPAVAEIEEMMRQCRPFGPDYCVLLAVREAMTTAAYHFTKQPFLYGEGR